MFYNAQNSLTTKSSWGPNIVLRLRKLVLRGADFSLPAGSV